MKSRSPCKTKGGVKWLNPIGAFFLGKMRTPPFRFYLPRTIPMATKISYDLLPAKLCNQSEEGLYIEIDHTLQAGSTLSIKLASPLEDHPEDTYSMYDGRVIWCKKVDEKTSRFGGGVKIVRKVVRADILTTRF